MQRLRQRKSLRVVQAVDAMGTTSSDTEEPDHDSLQQENDRLRRLVQDLQWQLHQRKSNSMKQKSAKQSPPVKRLPPPLPKKQEVDNFEDHEDEQPSNQQEMRGLLLHHRKLHPLTVNPPPPSIPHLQSPVSPKRQIKDKDSDHNLMPDYYEDGKDEEDENDYNDEYDIESPRLAKSTATSAESSALHHGLFSLRTILDRAAWLVGLLVLQSLSGVIIQHSEGLLQRHIVIVRFLTMLVGAGGNAGNQASVRVIRSLAVGTLHNRNLYRYLWREALVGLSLAVVLGFAGCLRAYIFDTAWWETVAISTSLFVIVLLSVLLGATLPLLMRCVGIDPAHSSTTIQVVMDILGVTITVVVSWLVLDSSLSWSKKNGSVGGE